MDDGESDSLDGDDGRHHSGRNNNRVNTRRPEQPIAGRRSRGRPQAPVQNIRSRTNNRRLEIEDESMLDDNLDTENDKTLDIETVD